MIYPNNGFLGSQAHHTLKDRRGEDVKFDDQPEADRGGLQMPWYPLVNKQFAIENGHWNSGFTLIKHGDFP